MFRYVSPLMILVVSTSWLTWDRARSEPINVYVEQSWGGMFIANIINNNITEDNEYEHGWKVDFRSGEKLMAILCNSAHIQQVTPTHWVLTNVTYNGQLHVNDTLILVVTGYISGLPSNMPLFTADMFHLPPPSDGQVTTEPPDHSDGTTTPPPEQELIVG